MKTFVKLIALVGVLGYLLFAIFKFVSPRNESPCSGLVVTVETANEDDAVVVDSATVARLLARHAIHPDSMRVADIDLLLIDSLLEADPYIQDAVVYMSSLNYLCVDITVVSPMLRVITATDDYYLDGKGNVIPAAGRFLNVPIVTGSVDRRWASATLPRFVQLLAADAFWGAEVEQINVEADSTLTLVPRTGDFLIRFGRPVNVADKLERLRLFYEKGLPRVGWNRYVELNIEYDNQIICTKKVKK